MTKYFFSNYHFIRPYLENMGPRKSGMDILSQLPGFRFFFKRGAQNVVRISSIFACQMRFGWSLNHEMCPDAQVQKKQEHLQPWPLCKEKELPKKQRE